MQTKAHLIQRRYNEDDILQAAQQIAESRVRKAPTVFTDPAAVKRFLRMKIGLEQREHFGVLFLCAQHKFIAFEVMFSGTLTQTSVYPREIIKRSLELHAAAIVLAHNHPSGDCNPSTADQQLTKVLRDSCHMVDVRVLDHIVVGANDTVSFAEIGLI